LNIKRLYYKTETKDKTTASYKSKTGIVGS